MSYKDDAVAILNTIGEEGSPHTEIWRLNEALRVLAKDEDPQFHISFALEDGRIGDITFRVVKDVKDLYIRMSDLVVRLLKRDEGYRRSVYTDSLGYYTIGIGRLVDGRKGGGITPEEAEFLLENDIEARMIELDARIPWWKGLNEVRQAVILSMAFQLGVPCLMLFENTLKAVEEGRFTDAETLMLRSMWAAQTPLRAHRLAEAMRTGSAEAFQLDEDPPA